MSDKLSVEINETINKLGTIVVSYPVLFIFILMVDAFYGLLFDVYRQKRLFISSISILFIRIAIILFI
ncbi:hypothetical protein [Virgibacillus proomii]|uniref:hypothetical protein n=1 Tax=Virgibacillus proomii TaxID=84407 RepID=UPI001C124D8C|nr:hypothetical protein [Virgibacillus proomii]MBU5267861.1 hypothetical protein [Virgibacillus proomii]